jgi:hypothetical protein
VIDSSVEKLTSGSEQQPVVFIVCVISQSVVKLRSRQSYIWRVLSGCVISYDNLVIVVSKCSYDC